MKRLLILLFLSVCVGLCIPIHSAESKSNQPVIVTIKSKGNKSTVARVPMRIQLDVTYNAELNAVEISCAEEQEAEAFLLYEGEVVDFASSIPAIFFLPSSTGSYTVTIENDSWVAEGILIL